METIYDLLNLFVLPFWALMIFAPRWGGTKQIMASFWPVIVLPMVYAGLLVSQLSLFANAPLDFSLAGIAALLGTPAGAAIGWAHFLAFDLFVGRWVYLDSQELGFSVWIISPVLFFVLMAGPLGLLFYLILRLYRK